MSELNYDCLKHAVEGNAAAFRLALWLEAVSPKVFPPTYEGGKYATETRRIDGHDLPCVLLDSVPSQANRMELALQDAWDAKAIQLPVVTVDFSDVHNPGVPRVTSLQRHPYRRRDFARQLGQQRKDEKRVPEILDRYRTRQAKQRVRYAASAICATLLGVWIVG